jgi:hypothetical protein
MLQPYFRNVMLSLIYAVMLILTHVAHDRDSLNANGHQCLIASSATQGSLSLLKLPLSWPQRLQARELHMA